MSQRNERSTPPERDRLTHWLIHRAAQRAPESLSSRLEEEWLADLESRSSTLARLRFALGCRWASLVIAHEFARNQVAATSSAVSAGGVVALANRNFGYFSLRSATLFLIAGLHAALFYGLITALEHTRGAPPPPDNLQNTEVHPLPPEPLPPLRAVITGWTLAPKVEMNPPPQVAIEREAPAKDNETLVEPQLPPIPEGPAHIVQRVTGGPGAGFPQTADFYPSGAIRAEEEGLSTVSVCVDPRGRLTSDPITVKSSGSVRLDEAARRLAQAGSGHYRASTEDGKALASCYPVGVRFQLKK